MRVRDERLRDLGGLTVEMYRCGAWRSDLLEERCAEVIGIDARLAEIDELLHGSEGTARCSCGAPVLRGSHFCPNCGRLRRRGAPRPRARRHDRSRAAAGQLSGRRGRRGAAALAVARAAARAAAPRASRASATASSAASRLPRRRRARSPALRRGWIAAPRLVPGRLRLARARRRSSSPSRAPPSRSRSPRARAPRRAATSSPRRSPAARRRRSSGRNGRTRWPRRPRRLDGRPRSRSPATHGRASRVALAAARRRDGLPQVGVLDSSAYASLHPGYFVVFSGVYGAPDDANRGARHASVRAASAAPTSCESPPDALARLRRALRSPLCFRKRKHL